MVGRVNMTAEKARRVLMDKVAPCVGSDDAAYVALVVDEAVQALVAESEETQARLDGGCA